MIRSLVETLSWMEKSIDVVTHTAELAFGFFYHSSVVRDGLVAHSICSNAIAQLGLYLADALLVGRYIIQQLFLAVFVVTAVLIGIVRIAAGRVV